VESSSRRGAITLYSGEDCPFSHRVRFILAEKGVNAEIRLVDPAAPPEELYQFNPYGELPVLVDRELVLYDSSIIMEYLDERFPHPPFMPVDPISRANARLMLHRIDRDWFSLVASLEAGNKAAVAAREQLRDGLSAISPQLARSAFLLGEQCTIVDCSLAVLLWRLPTYRVKLPSSGMEPLLNYASRLFRRESFRASLTEAEREHLPGLG